MGGPGCGIQLERAFAMLCPLLQQILNDPVEDVDDEFLLGQQPFEPRVRLLQLSDPLSLDAPMGWGLVGRRDAEMPL